MNDLDTLAALVELARQKPGSVRVSIRIADPYGFKDPGDVPESEREIEVTAEIGIKAPESRVRDAMARGIIGGSINRILRDE